MTVRNDLELIVDKNGDPLPQRYNPVTGEMELEDNNVQLTGSNVANEEAIPVKVWKRHIEVQSSTFDEVLSVPAGGNVSLTIQPPEEELWRVKFLTCNIVSPTGATTGTHRIRLRAGSNNARTEAVDVLNDYNKVVGLARNTFSTAHTSASPEDPFILAKNLEKIMITNKAPLTIRYDNYTDALQDHSITVGIVREAEKIV